MGAVLFSRRITATWREVAMAQTLKQVLRDMKAAKTPPVIAVCGCASSWKLPRTHARDGKRICCKCGGESRSIGLGQESEMTYQKCSHFGCAEEARYGLDYPTCYLHYLTCTVCNAKGSLFTPVANLCRVHAAEAESIELIPGRPYPTDSAVRTVLQSHKESK